VKKVTDRSTRTGTAAGASATGGDPNMDVLNLWLAARLVGAENVDKGKITEAEYQLQLAELNSRITDEKRRRSFANVQVASQVQAVQALVERGH
jgi:hypothetical protein